MWGPGRKKKKKTQQGNEDLYRDGKFSRMNETRLLIIPSRKRRSIPSWLWKVKPEEPPSITGRNERYSSCYWKQDGGPQGVKYRISTWPRNPAPQALCLYNHYPRDAISRRKDLFWLILVVSEGTAVHHDQEGMDGRVHADGSMRWMLRISW